MKEKVKKKINEQNLNEKENKMNKKYKNASTDLPHSAITNLNFPSLLSVTNTALNLISVQTSNYQFTKLPIEYATIQYKHGIARVQHTIDKQKDIQKIKKEKTEGKGRKREKKRKEVVENEEELQEDKKQEVELVKLCLKELKT